MEDIQTNTLSTNPDQIFPRDLDNDIQTANADPMNDFKFVRIIYHKTKDNAKHFAFEAENWKPMVQKAMNDGKTSLKGWGNSVIFSPQSNEFPFSSASYNLFSKAHTALSPAFSDYLILPTGFWDDLVGNYVEPRNSHL